MTRYIFHITFLFFFGLILGQSRPGYAGKLQLETAVQTDSTATDSTKVAEKYEPSARPTYQQRDRFGDPFSSTQSPSPLLLQDPSNLKLDLEIDTGMNYTIYERIGNLNYRPRTTMTFEQFVLFQEQGMKKEYWKNKSAGLDGESAVSARRLIPPIRISPAFDRIFGGNYVDIQPNGFVNMDFGGRWQKIQNPSIPVNQQRNGGFNYDQQISMNVVGNVGEKLSVTANFDNNNSFDFQNNLKIEYTGYEEDIIKKIEIGNVSMPVSNSLITGGQSLFGVKTQLQFGKLYVTALASRQQGTVRNQSFNNPSGDEDNQTIIRASDYDEYKHFFLGHFFRDNYEEWLSQLPQVRSSLLIQNLQVYVINRDANTQTESRRGIIALTDLGESNRIGNTSAITPTNNSRPTDNDVNTFFDDVVSLSGIRDLDEAPDLLTNQLGLAQDVDYSALPNVRKLDPTEYDVKDQLGYITLSSSLREGEILAVSYDYSYNGQNYQVGELPTANSDESSSEPLILKMLKPTQQNLDRPVWDLAMKNIYNLPGARNLSVSGFAMQIEYEDNTVNYNAPFLNEGVNTNNIPLMQVLKLDQLNRNNDPSPDSYFDFIEDVTIDIENGSIIFPVLEPFGSTLEDAFTDEEEDLVDKYVFNELYEQTKTNAELVSTKDKFQLVAEYEGGGTQKEYYLEGFNIAQGSVTVTSGSQVLTEGVDYRVDYTGVPKVTIINDGILSSGNQINISYEETDVFSFSSKWLTGARFDYQFNDRMNIGATVMHLNERTQGISTYSIGNEPVKNTKYGFDVNFEDESRILTKVVDALPLLSTKEESKVSFNGEFAQLISGTSNQVNGESTSYIDDFESTATTYQLGGGHLGWSLGSTPIGDGSLQENFDRREDDGSQLGIGYKRAKLAWYTIDQSFYANNVVSDAQQQEPYARVIGTQELFPSLDASQIGLNFLSTFDVAYYPQERGPYNYNNDPNEYNRDGTFANPRSNFGAIMRQVPADFDFNRTNIEYIEFWLLDPFIAEESGGLPGGAANSGELIFNLGEVLEDVLKDNKTSMENGLSADGSEEFIEESDWGRIGSTSVFNQGFDLSSSARVNQDLGLDGLPSGVNDLSGVQGSDVATTEFGFFQEHMSPILNSNDIDEFAKQSIEQDISGDDFQFYLDDEFDDNGAGILERYKNYNGMEGNSPTASSGSDFSTSATNDADHEDLNGDFNATSGESESYFEYRMSLAPGTLNLNNQYIVDEIEDAQDNKWYLFRIPVQQPDRSINNPSYNSLRFMRMYLTGWQSPVVLRMASFQLVASQWRKYTGNLSSDGFGVVPEPVEGDFDLSIVSIEQNGEQNEDGSPQYVVPPGIDRNLDNTTAITRRVNEQSLRLCVNDLQDDDARAAYKTPVDFDLVNYGKLKMFFHAEKVSAADDLQDNQVTGFLRLGRDDTENYYEIELPLTLTEYGITSDTLNDEGFRRLIWPEENEIDIEFSRLFNLKSERNEIINRGGDSLRVDQRTSVQFGKYKLTVKGNPKLSELQLMMIGVRNPLDSILLDRGDKSVCIWANELRVTDFDDQNGWAANARLNVQLADFATISASTQYTSIGFGGIQDRIAERSREENIQYDVSANVNVDKLIPWETGIQIPMFVSASRAIQTPQYDPLDSDLPLDVALDEFLTSEEREDYKNKVISKQSSRSINFMNVRKEKVKEDAKKHIYDIENFSFSYAFSEDKSSDENTAERLQKSYFGSVSYSFNLPATQIEPFKSLKAFSSPYLQLIKDINFSPLPNNISARGSIDRSFLRTQYRNADLTTDGLDPNFEKLFYFDRNYSVRWNIFKNLSLNYDAAVNAIVDEFVTEVRRDSEGNIIYDADSTIVLDTLLYIDGAVDTRRERSIIWDEIVGLGRTKNYSQTISANYRLPLDKIPLTDWISADYRYAVDYNWAGTNISQAETFGNTLDNSRTQDVNARFDLVKLYNKSKKLSKINSPPRRSSRRRAEVDTTKQMGTMTKGFFRLLMALRSVNFTYSQREGTTLPGFKPVPYALGMDDAWEAPGWSFIAGSQDPNVRFRAAESGWLVTDTTFSAPFLQTLNRELNLRATIEPLKDFRLQVDMKRSSTSQYQEIFRYDEQTGEHVSLTPSRSGNYSITFMPISTTFDKDDNLNNSKVFDQFVENRAIIQQRLNQLAGAEYGINSQDVLIPAFIAAYTDQSASRIRPSPVPKIPMPNWRLDYAGLSKLKSLQSIFSSVNITHAYSSTFSISNYRNSSLYQNSADLDLTNDILNYPVASITGDDGVLTPVFTIDQVSISERFSPLIGVNVRTKSNLTLKLEYSKERNLVLDLSNAQVTEQKNSNVTFDFGFAKDKMKLPFRIQGRTVVVENELQFRAAVTVRDTRTVQRIIGDANTLTQGNVNYQVRPTISYVASQRLNVTMYYERTINRPRLSTSFPLTTTAFGVQVRFSLAQ